MRAAGWDGSSPSSDLDVAFLSRPAPVTSAVDLLLDGLARLTTEGYAAGAPTLMRALAASGGTHVRGGRAALALARLRVARALADDASWDELRVDSCGWPVRPARFAASRRPERALRRPARRRGIRLRDVAARRDERGLEATGSHLRPHGAVWLAVWRGRRSDGLGADRGPRDEVLQRGEGFWMSDTEWTRSILYLGLGRYEEALSAAERAGEDPPDLGLSTWAWPELIEAAARSGHADRAAEALRRLAEIARACGTGLGLGARGALARAGVRGRRRRAPSPRSDRTARSDADSSGARPRAHLLYGEWLRRERRRVDAREQLRLAHDMFAGMGAEAFAERARRELLATGRTVRKRSVDTLDELTAQEAQIAQLAGDGGTNPEIGAQLF